MPECMAQPKIFQGRNDFVELGHFDENFFKNTRKKKVPQGDIFEVFLLVILKNYILNGKCNTKMDTIRALF